MVHIVNSSPVCSGYRETNRQLARENGEIKQLLTEVMKECAQRREEIHKCHVRIIELEIMEKKYNALKQKYNSIVKIIESPDETLSITAHSNDQQSTTIILPLPQASDIEECNSQTANTFRLDVISEHGDEEEELEQDATLRQTPTEIQTTTTAQSPIQNTRTYSLYDSLEPADVTSMPSLDPGGPPPEQATLSIYKCLDDTKNTPTSEKDRDMFQSTPKKPVLANADSRVNMSPLIRGPEMEIIHSIVQHQQLQQQQNQSQQQLLDELNGKEKEVKKAKRKSKQKEEDAKRPRTYNLRKRN